MKEKQCRKCRRHRSASEFHLNGNRRDGLSTQCKECKRDYYKTRRMRALQKARDRYAANRHTKLVYAKQYASKHRARLLQYYRQYYRLHRDALLRSSRVRYRTNPTYRNKALLRAQLRRPIELRRRRELTRLKHQSQTRNCGCGAVFHFRQDKQACCKRCSAMNCQYRFHTKRRQHRAALRKIFLSEAINELKQYGK